MVWFWLLGLGLLCVAVGGVWWRVTQVDFLPRLIAWLVQKTWPIIWKEITKQMTPEMIEEMNETFRSGGEWDHIRKRPKEKR